MDWPSPKNANLYIWTFGMFRYQPEVVRFSGTLNLQVFYTIPAQTVQGFCSSATNAYALDCSTFNILENLGSSIFHIQERASF